MRGPRAPGDGGDVQHAERVHAAGAGHEQVARDEVGVGAVRARRRLLHVAEEQVGGQRDEVTAFAAIDDGLARPAARIEIIYRK